ncbi:MAG: hypothetical protein Greene041619_259 [Candidatus Peregrinibacteria bacterium Greene0416_19]|nr:MAG: hypothetical protein Greene041619_259 [Candidatus Peregrinibacteria bacterium Greene0416_19]
MPHSLLLYACSMKIILAVPAPVWLLLSALFFAWGEYTSKQWGYAPSLSLTLMTVGIYALGTLAWLPALLHNNHLAIMGTAWLLLATIATVAIGIFVFHEHVSTVKMIGIFFSLLSLVLLSI